MKTVLLGASILAYCFGIVIMTKPVLFHESSFIPNNISEWDYAEKNNMFYDILEFYQIIGTLMVIDGIVSICTKRPKENNIRMNLVIGILILISAVYFIFIKYPGWYISLFQETYLQDLICTIEVSKVLLPIGAVGILEFAFGIQPIFTEKYLNI